MTHVVRISARRNREHEVRFGSAGLFFRFFALRPSIVYLLLDI
jgi:hypothetical protein